MKHSTTYSAVAPAVKGIRLDVYHIADLPFGQGHLRRSWDGSLYLEVGIKHFSGGFGPPPAGPQQPFRIERGNLVRDSEFGYGGRICSFPHQRISLSQSVIADLEAKP